MLDVAVPLVKVLIPAKDLLPKVIAPEAVVDAAGNSLIYFCLLSSN
jgi:hypothetical protein